MINGSNGYVWTSPDQTHDIFEGTEQILSQGPVVVAFVSARLCQPDREAEQIGAKPVRRELLPTSALAMLKATDRY